MKCWMLLLAIFSACFGVSYGIQCYACTYTSALSSLNSWCAESFTNGTDAADSVIECSGVCAKTRGEILGIVGIERKCKTDVSSASACLNGCGRISGISGCEHCCDTDLCNGAASVTFNLLAAVAMLLFARLVSSC